MKKHIATTIQEYLNEKLNDTVYYHGSKYKFDKLQKDVGNKTGGDEYGYGIYLTPNKSLASHYAKENGFIYNVKIPNNLIFIRDNKKLNKSILDKVRTMIINNDFIDSEGNIMTNDHKLYILNNMIIKESTNGLNLYNKFLRIFPISNKQLSNMLDSVGINGIIGNDNNEIVIFNPLNIKILSIEEK